MKSLIDLLKGFCEENKEDLKLILYIGVPFGIILLLLGSCLDFSHAF